MLGEHRAGLPADVLQTTALVFEDQQRLPIRNIGGIVGNHVGWMSVHQKQIEVTVEVQVEKFLTPPTEQESGMCDPR